MPVVIEFPDTPYTAMVFDIDNTLTSNTSNIDKKILDELLYFLKQGVNIALVSAQGIDEIKKYVIDVVPHDKKLLLKNLFIYPAAGAQAFGFDEAGYLINEPLYDKAKNTVLETNLGVVEDAIRSVVGPKSKIHSRGGITTVSHISDRNDAREKLTVLFSEKNWPLVPRIAGGRSLHILVKGTDKGEALKHFIDEVAQKQFKQTIPGEKVLIIGDSFYPGGLDMDKLGVIKGACVVSVGKKPAESEKSLKYSQDFINDKNQAAS